MLLTPRMCYQREFLGPGLFNMGPSCALFRAEVLRELGGFVDWGAPSDGIFWLRACARHHVLLLPADLFWYRIHPNQELQSDKASRQYAVAFWLFWQALHAPECPLTPDEQMQARRNLAYILARATFRDVKAGRWRIALLRLRNSGFSGWDWARYLRRPRRHPFAGTPLAEDGDYLVPAWSCFQLTPMLKGGAS
jgi:hypothetical protein